MASNIKNVLVVGAGGRLGPTILSALSTEPSFALSVLTRHSSISHFPPGIAVHRTGDDYPESDLLTAFKGQDAVISTVASESVTTQKKLIDAAVKAGVKRFVPSEFGGDIGNQKAVEVLPQYFGVKKDIIDYLKGNEKEGLSWTTFVTGWFFDLGLKLGYMGFNVKEHKARILNNGTDRFSTTTLPTVGLAVKNALLHPQKTANKSMYIHSFTVSPKQVLAALEKATGDKWNVTYVDAEEQKKAGLERMSKGEWNAGRPLLLQYICTVAGYGGDHAEHRMTANDLLELPKENMEEVVANVAKGMKEG